MSKPERRLDPERSSLDRFGYELRKWRKVRGLSQERAGALVHVSGALLQRIEIGERRPARDLAVRCDEVLRAGGALIEAWEKFSESEVRQKLREYDTDITSADAGKSPGEASTKQRHDFANSVHIGLTHASAPSDYDTRARIRTDVAGQSGSVLHDDGDETVRRRAFLVNMALLVEISRNDPMAALESIRRELGTIRSVDSREADICEWDEIASEYGATYPIVAPYDLLRPLLVDFAALQEAFWLYPREVDQRELHRVTALLAGFLAQTVNNLGHASESRRWWRTARFAADRADDSYSPLWVRGREIIHAMGERPVGEVLRLIDEAEKFTKCARPELVLEFLGGKAQTLALADRTQEAENALNQLRDRFSASPSTGYSGSVLGWGEERLRNTESYTYSRLGDHAGVEGALNAAATLYKYDPTNLRWPTGAELNRAFCLVQNGDLSEGLSHARAVVARLPSSQQTHDMYVPASEVLRAVPWSKQNAPALNGYGEWLEATFLISAHQRMVLPSG